MIKGLNRFSEYFTGFENSYVLIGALQQRNDNVWAKYWLKNL